MQPLCLKAAEMILMFSIYWFENKSLDLTFLFLIVYIIKQDQIYWKDMNFVVLCLYKHCTTF